MSVHEAIEAVDRAQDAVDALEREIVASGVRPLAIVERELRTAQKTLQAAIEECDSVRRTATENRRAEKRG